MSLSNVQIKNAKPKEKPYKLFDGYGLFLLVKPGGSKLWHFKYFFEGKEKLISFGVYDDVPLSLARERRTDARRLLAVGTDPGQNRKAIKAAKAENNANTFEVVAREWIERQSDQWTESNKEKILQRMEKDIFPWLGKRPVADITAQELLKVLKRVEERGARDTAHRALQNCGRILKYVIVTGRAKYDVSRDLEGALLPVIKGHHAAITDPKRLGILIKACNEYEGHFATCCALRLSPLVFLRPGELRQAEWAEIDFENAQWVIPSNRMKMKNPGGHIVPLSRQALNILKELHPLTGNGKYVFPSVMSRSKPISDNTINTSLRRMGFTKNEVTAHGFRATARTILDEVLGIRPDFIEHQLAHVVKDPNGRAYNRTAHLDARRDMMQKWADYLEGLINLTPQNKRVT